jgi:hypothetical protein
MGKLPSFEELLSVYDMTNAEVVVHLRRLHFVDDIVSGVDHRAEHEQLHTRRENGHAHARSSIDRQKVVDVGGMDEPTLWKHISHRHPELRFEYNGERPTDIARHEHALSHKLLPNALGHWHE